MGCYIHIYIYLMKSNDTLFFFWVLRNNKKNAHGVMVEDALESAPVRLYIIVI